MGRRQPAVEDMVKMAPRIKDVRKKRVLLTGSAGYIGTVMTAMLKEGSYFVVGLDNEWFGANTLFDLSENNIPDRNMRKDIRNVSIEDLQGIDAVIHLAGLSNDPLGEINPALTDEINYKATVRLAELSKRAGVKRFVFASSCSIYGISASDKPIDESGRLNPLTAYARAKVDAENGIAALADNGFHPVFMRNATVYGLSPRLRLDLVVNNLSAWAYVTGEIAIMSDGTPWRPIVHIRDFCAASIAALEAPIDNIHCEVFNVGTDGSNYQVKDIAMVIKEFVPKAEIKILNRTGPDERTYKVDFSKIKNRLPEFKPKWSLTQGVEELLGAYREHSLTKDGFDSDKYFRIRTIRSLIEAGTINTELLPTEAAK